MENKELEIENLSTLEKLSEDELEAVVGGSVVTDTILETIAEGESLSYLY